MEKRILEAGHYYVAKGPTAWSVIGWNILESLKRAGDATLIFIDDVHTLRDVNPAEMELTTVEFSPLADFIMMESGVMAEASEILRRLQEYSVRSRRARESGGRWFCSGHALTLGGGAQTCLLLDAGLSLYKLRLGFTAGVNILPEFYAEEQVALQRILAKALPEFTLTVVLYDLNGNYRVLD